MNLRFLISQDGDSWVAQCVEYDFAAQGRTPSECRRNMASQIHAEIRCSVEHTGEVFGGIPEAPEYLVKEWDSAENEFRMSAEVLNQNDALALEYRLVG